MAWEAKRKVGGATAAGRGLSAADMASVGQRRGQAVGSSESEGIASDIAAKMVALGNSTGSALNMRKSCIRLVLM